MSQFCKSCGFTSAENDDAMGHTVCTQCGAVLEENAIVSEVTFTEKSNGAAVADGFYVSAEKARAHSKLKLGKGAGQQGAQESREQTIQKGRQRIAQLAAALDMNEKHVEAAARYFNLAIVNNFTRGRKTVNVVAACLYIVCRMEKTSHMLIDFSDVLQTDVYILGSTFLKLVQLLHLNLPLVDPALYLTRFAAKLEFGEKTGLVVRDSLRLVQRMSRDWMQTGRRPGGICAACLLIAARMHNFKRTRREVISVVRICDATLRKRLEEFKQTPSSDLTVGDFQNVWLEQEADPPAFTNPKKRKPVVDEVSDEANTLEDLTARAIASRSKGEGATDVNEDMDQVENDFDATLKYQESHDNLRKRKVVEVPKIVDPYAHVPDDVVLEKELDLLDGDHEIANALLDTEEVEFKTMIWTNENKDWLEAQAEKKRKELELREKGLEPKPPRVRRRKKDTDLVEPEKPKASSAAEAAKNMLTATSKRISKKLNYAAIDNLFQVDESMREKIRLKREASFATSRATSAAP